MNLLSFIVNDDSLSVNTDSRRGVMKEAREAYSHVRRNQILHAAITSFARNGFHKTTMQDIATEARLSPGALYRYFESKEQIIEVCSSASQEHNDSLFQEARKHESLLEATSTLIDTIFSLLDNPDALKSLPLEIELWAEASRSPKILDMVRAGRDSFLA
jgi:AcrR family transcriptional regulator